MLKPGDSFERYTIEALLGQGGMGAVYRAHDARLGRRVALKVISDGAGSEGGAAEAKARLLREARASAALDHPNAVAIFDVGELEGAPYIVMELVEGRTLRGAAEGGALSIEARIAKLADVARALAGAHRRGLVHRDIKPENVMVRDDGMVKVLDFGIARRSRAAVDPNAATQTPSISTLTVDGAKLGTPVYMAPEQIRGDTLDGRADQFSWGVVAYELLAGRLPWRGAGDALAVMASALTDPADPAPLEQAGVPAHVRRAVLRALAKKPEERFASMDDVVHALTTPEESAPDPAPGATMAQRFSTGDVREVLARAVDEQAKREGASGKLRFEDLLTIAAEVGVDEESLRQASRALRGRGEEQLSLAEENARRDAWLRRQRRDFWRHAGVFAVVNPALLFLGLVLLSFTPWWVWFLPLVAWSVGLAIHGLVALSTNEDDWREHEEGMQRWEESRRRRHEMRMAVIQMRTGREPPRRRIEAAPEPRGKLRVADTGRDREHEAEEEADFAARPERRHHRR